MRFRLYFQALLSFTVVLASSSYVVHETLPAPPGYEKSHRPNPKSTIPLRIYVVQRDAHLIPDLLLNVSLPDSPHYGSHWTPQQVADTFHNGDSLHEVREWLVNNGVNGSRILVGRGAGWVGVRDATVEEAESLLRSEYWVYKSSDGSTIDHVAPTQYSLPRHLADHVDFVLTTPPPQRKARNGPVSTVQELGQVNISQILEQLDNCAAHITPVCLRSLYGVVYEPQVPDKNSYGIVEYTPQAFVQSDLDIFFGNFSGDSGFRPGATPKVVGIDGGFVQTTDKGFDYNGESNLDLQYGMEMVSSKQPVTLYQVGDAQEGASFNNFLDALDASYCGGDDPNYDAVYPDTFPGGYKGPPDCGTSKPANVISTSYGYNEAELSPKYMERQCLEYAKLGLMGVTVLYSSGDSGVGGDYDTCLDDKGHESYSGKRFNPSFPSTCPWVTSVGATMIVPEATTKATSRDSSARRYKEMACEKVIYSGGGFSNVFRMPDYQSVVVKSYLKSYADTVQYGTPAGYRWNNTGSRAFPDISANGANYVVAVNGKFSLVYGTSASAPVVGGLFTLINDARIARGKRPIGFVNPTLYHASFTKAFHDIVSGGNRGCGTPGFKAVAGWDPVTGMGTPNFAAMMDRWLYQ